ncbi:MAG: low temperature requirement protein A [Rhizobacter sp.]
MPPLISPIRLRSLAHESARKVTWLELFFDLIFVAAVSQLASPLKEDYSVAGLVRFAPLFLLTWLAWTGHASYATRFDTDDVVQRGLTLVQMFTVAVMAANAKDSLDSRSSAGFVAAYGVVRLLLVAHYARARRVPGARGLATRYAFGHGLAAVIWLVSGIAPLPLRYALWVVAFAIDLGTPWTAVPHSVDAPPDAAHLPERFGLFTLILLGESVVAVMHGMESQEGWPVEAAASAFLGMASLFFIWWWYFDGADAASEQRVQSGRDAVRFHIWTYAHYPLCLGIVVVGVGIERTVSAAAHAMLATAETSLAAGGAALVMVAMTVVDGSSQHEGHSRRVRPAALALAALVLGAGLWMPIVRPVALIMGLSAALLTQLGLALTRATRRS